MKEPPLVSVSMIFYNPGSFFTEAIRSVLEQRFGDWELLLVDDGSTDGSETVARQYAQERPGRIRYLHHPGRVNRGTAPTRNLGLAESRGRYFTEIDADDVWLPGFLEHHVGVLEAHPEVEMAFSPVQRWYSWSGDPQDIEKDWVAHPWSVSEGVMEPPGLFPVMLEAAPRGGVPKGLVMRREAVTALGGYPESFRDMYEDQALLAKLTIRCRAWVGGKGEWLYRYRRHPESMVTVMNTHRNRRLMRLKFLEWLDEYVREEEINDPTVVDSVARELWKVNHPQLQGIRRWVEHWGGRVRRKAHKLMAGSAPRPQP